MSTLWKSGSPLHPLFSEIQGCLDDDWFLFEHEVALQRAHGTVLHRAALLDDGQLDGLNAALDDIESTFDRWEVPSSEAEDIHTWIEGEITARCPEAGRRIHTARSRNDQVATLLLLHLRAAGDELADSLDRLRARLVERVDDWADLEMPMQTHLQFAAPGSVGAWPLRYATSLARLSRQLDFLRGEWAHWCPLGAGAVAGSSLPIDRSLQAELLDFDEPWPSSLDATSSRDACLEMLAWCAQISLQLQALAADGQVFAQTPFSFTHYPKALATGSSMMPNKSNPDALELLRGEANAAAAAHVQATLILKGLPSGYQRDLQCVKPLVRDVPALVRDLLELAHAYVDALEFDAERVAAALATGDVGATLRMEARVAAGQALRDAHHSEADGKQDDTPDSGATAYVTHGSASPDAVRASARHVAP